MMETPATRWRVKDHALASARGALVAIGAFLIAIPTQAPASPNSGVAVDAQIASHLGYEGVVSGGDSLDRILADAGINATSRAEAALAIEDVYDLATLRPGDILRWQVDADQPTSLSRLSLAVADGSEVTLDFRVGPKAERFQPKTSTRERRAVLTLDGPLTSSLHAQKIPESIAVELAAAMAGQVDFRRDIQGDETLALLWQETVTETGKHVDGPRIRYARLQLDANLFELVVPEGSDSSVLLKNGAPVQVTAPPIQGARLSSVFGRRTHPLLGGRRMHTGVDYAAPTGTRVTATGAGRVVFAGTMRGYGKTLDIDHGGGVITRYAHLSRIGDGMDRGARVDAGEAIGAVGATGLVSGPNLHYEVRVDGRPVDPIADDAVVEAPEPEPTYLSDLERARQAFVAVVPAPL